MTLKKAYVDLLFRRVQSLDLDYDKRMLETTFGKLAEIYNGCGAESWHPKVRDFATKIFSWGEPAFLVHDWDFSELDKTKLNFDLANKRCETNLKKLAKTSTGGWLKSPWKYWLRLGEAKAFRVLLDEFGQDAFFPPTEK